MNRTDILLLGAGGHALACVDVLLLEGRHRIVGLLGCREELGRAVGGFPVIGEDADLPKLLPQGGHALVAVGQIRSPEARRRLYAQALAAGAALPVVVSPRAYVSPLARIGAGTIVMHGAIVNAGAEIGENCIINSRALIEHGARVGAHCHVSTGAILNGDARLGAGSFLGSGAVVRHGATIGEGAFVRMGEVVKHDLPGG